MRWIALSFVLAFGWALPAMAQDNTGVTNWRTYCLDTRGARSSAFALADAAGWTATRSPNTTRFHADGSVLMIPDSQNGRSSCITSHPSGTVNATAALQALLQNTPTYMDGGWAVWVFDATSGELDWIANSDAERMQAAIANDRVVFVRSGVQTGLDILMIEYPASMLAVATP